jgi:hypothetical protein
MARRSKRIDCTFCGDLGVPQGIEDVLPLWLAKKLAYQAETHHPGVQATYRKYSYDDFAALQTDDGSGSTATSSELTGKLPKGFLLPGVCIGCNGGWMSRLEEVARLTLTGLLIGEPKRLTPFDQTTIATWAIKTSLTYDACYDPRYVPEDIGTRRLFARGAPLPDTAVFIGHDPDLTPMGEFVHARQPTVTDDGTPIGVTIGFQFDHLILKTIIGLQATGLALVAPISSDHRTQIWPPRQAFVWPSVAALVPRKREPD